MKKNVFILGIGRFGLAAALKLSEENVNVTIVDSDERRIKEANITDKVNDSLVLDTSNYEQLASTSILSADHVIVAISDIESSIMTCVNLKELGIKNIIAKARSDSHSKVLMSLGIKDVIFPEQVIGIQIAKKILSYHNDIDYLYNGEKITMLSIKLNNDNLIGRNINEFENKDAYNIFAIRTNQPLEPLIMNLENYKLQKLDKIFIIIANDKLKYIKKYFKDFVEVSKNN